MSRVSGKVRSYAGSKSFGTAALAFSLVTPAVLHAQSSGVALATPPGQFSVSASGAATYFIPLRVGPGLGGIAPNLGLAYHSQSAGGDGLMGMAWNLTGLSSIERCPKTVAQDGARGSVNFNDDDRYCLDGQRLLLVSGTYGQDGAQYRTEFENFSKIVGSGRAGNGAASFKVWTKSGTLHEYGTSTDARVEAVYAPGTTPAWPSATVRVWALNKISDAKGNYLTVAYNKDSANGVYSPARIDYAANSVANTQPQSSVVFSYTALLNPIPKYSAGAISRRSTALSEISTYYQGSTLIGKTKLTYQNAGATQTPRLASVQSCDANSNCLLPLNMAYAIERTGFSDIATSWPLQSGAVFQNESSGEPYGAANPVTKVSLVDLNGDGLPDLYITKTGWDTNGALASPKVYLNTGNGFSALATSWPLQPGATFQNESSAEPYGVANPVTKVSLVDLNGDGLPDLYVTKTGWDTNGAVASPKAYLNTGNGFASVATSWPLQPGAVFQNESSGEPYGAANPVTKVSLVDLNGDGLTDLYVTKTGWDTNGALAAPKVYLNQTQPPYLLTSVGSAIGASTSITYGGLSNPAIYTKDSGSNAAAYPKVDMLSSPPVVASASFDNGIGGANTVSYSYGGLKKEVGTGRGSLGFRWTKSKNLTTGIEQYSEYRQDFPYTGMLAKSETRLAGAGNGGVLKRTISTPACHIPASGAQCALTPGATYFRHVASTVDESWDLNGTGMPSFTSNLQYSSFPHYGDPSQTSVMSSDGIGKTTTLTYWPADTSNWVVGRVKSSVVTSTSP